MTDRFSSEALELLPIGAQARIRIDDVPKAPVQTWDMTDSAMLQHAKDAWMTAWKLKRTLELWQVFQTFQVLAITIDNGSQEKINAIVPELRNLKAVLDAWAHLKSEEKGGQSNRVTFQFPVGEWFNLYDTFRDVIASETKALCRIGVNSQFFALPLHEVQQQLDQIMKGEFDLVTDPPKIHFAKHSPGGAENLIASVTEVLKFLATAPAAALKVPKKVEPSNELYKHSDDFVSVVWGGVSYTFARGHQVDCIRVLWEAWEVGTPALAEKEIGIAIEAENGNFQLAKVFRRKRKTKGYEQHPAFGIMIQKAGRGLYRLVEQKKRDGKTES